MGWLGLTEQELYDTDINAIIIGYEGKLEMLKACFGSNEKDGSGKGKNKPTADDIRSFSKEHNAVMRKRKK